MTMNKNSVKKFFRTMKEETEKVLEFYGKAMMNI